MASLMAEMHGSHHFQVNYRGRAVKSMTGRTDCQVYSEVT